MKPCCCCFPPKICFFYKNKSKEIIIFCKILKTFVILLNKWLFEFCFSLSLWLINHTDNSIVVLLVIQGPSNQQMFLRWKVAGFSPLFTLKLTHAFLLLLAMLSAHWAAGVDTFPWSFVFVPNQGHFVASFVNTARFICSIIVHIFPRSGFLCRGLQLQRKW